MQLSDNSLKCHRIPFESQGLQKFKEFGAILEAGMKPIRMFQYYGRETLRPTQAILKQPALIQHPFCRMGFNPIHHGAYI